MKTSKKTLRGTITSSLLTMALAVSMMPATGIAFAAEQMGANADEAAQSAAPTANDDAAQAETAPESSATNEVDETVTASEVADPANTAGEASDAAASSDAAGNAAGTPAAPSYTSNAVDRVQANVPVSAEGVVLGNIEYQGLTYRINPDSTTAALVGLGTQAPSGTLSIPSQVAAGGKLYTVTGIENCVGGGSLK